MGRGLRLRHTHLPREVRYAVVTPIEPLRLRRPHITQPPHIDTHYATAAANTLILPGAGLEPRQSRYIGGLFTPLRHY